MRVLLVVAVMLLAGCVPAVIPPEPALWGSLQPGPYQVGFGIRWETDATRTYDQGADRTIKKPRPIPVGVWYPARPSPAAHVQVADYLDMRGKQTQFDALAQRLNEHIKDSLSLRMFNKKAWNELSAPERTAADQYMAMRADATFDGPPAQGRFPVVIYNPGDSGHYAENFVLFEFLASNGYIVLSTSYHCEDAKTVAPCDETARHRDMEFLLRFAALLANADASHVAVIGHTEGARAAMAWASEVDTPLDAVIGIHQGTVDRASVVPAMQFADLEPKSYVTDGIMQAKTARENYESTCRKILQFLDESVKRIPKRNEAPHDLGVLSLRHGTFQKAILGH